MSVLKVIHVRISCLVSVLMAVAIFLAATVPGYSQVTLNRATRDYFEGEWRLIAYLVPVDPCAEVYEYPPGTDVTKMEVNGDIFTFEFRRSGGTVNYDDLVDFGNRARITQASRTGNAVRLGLNWGGDRPQEVLLRILDENRMRVTQLRANAVPYFVSGILHRCKPARHEVMAGVSEEWLFFLTELGDAHLVEYGPYLSSCAPGKGTDLEFDLIGPSWFGGWEGRNHWTVTAGRELPDGTLVLEMDARSAHPRLTIQRTGPGRITIAELGKSYMRCLWQ
jgi:hypothetical protein